MLAGPALSRALDGAEALTVAARAFIRERLNPFEVRERGKTEREQWWSSRAQQNTDIRLYQNHADWPAIMADLPRRVGRGLALRCDTAHPRPGVALCDRGFCAPSNPTSLALPLRDEHMHLRRGAVSFVKVSTSLALRLCMLAAMACTTDQVPPRTTGSGDVVQEQLDSESSHDLAVRDSDTRNSSGRDSTRYDTLPPYPVQTYPAEGRFAWSRLDIVGVSPVIRDSGSLVYDPMLKRHVLYGGLERRSTTSLWQHSDVWALSLSESETATWTLLISDDTPLTTSGADGPHARYGHCAVWDAGTQRMVVFGGRNLLKAHEWAGEHYDGSNDEGFNDVWELDLSSPAPYWTQLSVLDDEVPAPRWAHGCGFVEARRWLIVYAGESYSGGSNSDLWVLDLSTSPAYWRSLSPETIPPARSFGQLGPEPGQPGLASFVTRGGYARGSDVEAKGLFLDSWRLRLIWPKHGSASDIVATWTELPTDPMRDLVTSYSMRFYDDNSDSVLELPGGRVDISAPDDPKHLLDGSVWSLDRETDEWNQVAIAGAPPRARTGLACSYDSSRDAYVVFGGAGQVIDVDPPTAEHPAAYQSSNETYLLLRSPSRRGAPGSP